jgi:putative restriction endonuclease
MDWTREHLLIALNLYSKLSFGSLSGKNKIVKQIAEKLGRTPGSLGRKLTNFAALDPVVAAERKKGSPHYSKHDEQIWREFQLNASVLIAESERLLVQLFSQDESATLVRHAGEFALRITPAVKTTEAPAAVIARRGQDYFREAVLCSYDRRCCITGLNVEELLNASHVLPWAKYPEHRLNISNGLCLSVMLDRAFDRGLIAFDETERMIVSTRLRRLGNDTMINQHFLAYEGCQIRPAERLARVSPEFLQEHRRTIFSSD